MIHRLFRYKPNRVTLIGWGLAGLLVGIYFAKFGYSLAFSWLLCVIPLGFLVIKKRVVSICAVLLIGFIIGGFRAGIFYQQVAQYQNYYGKIIVATGSVIDDMSYDERRQTEFHIGNVRIEGSELPGRIRVSGFGANQVTRGDVVQVKGRLNQTKGTSRQGSIAFGEITVIGKNNSRLEKIRGQFFASIYSSLPEPQASLGLGYLVGVRTALPEDFSEKLALVGLTHIVAVSGYNLTILVQMVRRLFAKSSAYQSVLFSGILIVGFLLMTGWSPSIMRAAIVTGFSLLAWYYGRKMLPLLLLLLGGAITGVINPLYVWGDAGWYLSFLAFSGVLILAPLFIARVYKNKKPAFFTALLIETLSAIIMTAPYIAWLFGKFSLIAPVANLVVVPLIPLSMLLVFITGITGMFFPALALWIAIFPRAILTFHVWAVEKLSSVPGAQLSVTFTASMAIVAYVILIALMLYLWLTHKKRIDAQKIQPIDWSLV